MHLHGYFTDNNFYFFLLESLTFLNQVLKLINSKLITKIPSHVKNSVWTLGQIFTVCVRGFISVGQVNIEW